MNVLYHNLRILQTDDVIEIEDNYYVNASDLNSEVVLEESNTTYECPWKGHANYYNVTISDEVVKDGAWTYHSPNEAAEEIKDRIAFDSKVFTFEL